MIHVMDSSVLLVVAKGEPGAEAVMELLHTQECVISSVNFAEVGTKLIDFGLPEAELKRGLAQFRLEVIDFDARQATACAALRAVTRAQGLSLGDRAWADVEASVMGVRVLLIR